MVVTALYTEGGTRSVDVTVEKFRTKAECARVAHEAHALVKKASKVAFGDGITLHPC